MHEMFKLNSKNMSINISIQSHILDYDNHLWHPQNRYKQQTFGLLPWEKYTRKKTLLLDFRIKTTKMCISTQVNDPPNYDTQAFINSFS